MSVEPCHAGAAREAYYWAEVAGSLKKASRRN